MPIMKQNIKKPILIILLTLLVVGLVGGAVYEYQTHKPKPGISLSQALKQRNSALAEAAAQKSINEVNSAKYNEVLGDKQNRLTTACNQLRTLTKAVTPACN